MVFVAASNKTWLAKGGSWSLLFSCMSAPRHFIQKRLQLFFGNFYSHRAPRLFLGDINESLFSLGQFRQVEGNDLVKNKAVFCVTSQAGQICFLLPRQHIGFGNEA